MFEYEEGTTDEIGTPEPKPSALRDDKPPMAVQLQLRKMADAKNQAKAEAKTAREEAEAAKALAAELPTLKAQLATLMDELDLSRAGLNDPKAIKVARMEYDDLPEADRPKTLGEFFTSIKALAASEPDKVPKALTPWITNPGTDPAPKRDKAPPDDGSTGKLPPSGDVISASAIKTARERWQRTGSEADRLELERLVSLQEKKRA